jgi:hypothetical protein
LTFGSTKEGEDVSKFMVTPPTDIIEVDVVGEISVEQESDKKGLEHTFGEDNGESSEK